MINNQITAHSLAHSAVYSLPFFPYFISHNPSARISLLKSPRSFCSLLMELIQVSLFSGGLDVELIPSVSEGMW